MPAGAQWSTYPFKEYLRSLKIASTLGLPWHVLMYHLFRINFWRNFPSRISYLLHAKLEFSDSTLWLLIENIFSNSDEILFVNGSLNVMANLKYLGEWAHQTPHIAARHFYLAQPTIQHFYQIQLRVPPTFIHKLPLTTSTYRLKLSPKVFHFSQHLQVLATCSSTTQVWWLASSCWSHSRPPLNMS